MDLKQILTIVVKLCALPIAALGIVWLYLFVSAVFSVNDLIDLILIYALMLMGLCFVWVAYDVIRFYTRRSVQLLLVLLMLIAYNYIADLGFGRQLAFDLGFLAPVVSLLVAFITYKVLFSLICRYTNIRLVNSW